MNRKSLAALSAAALLVPAAAADAHKPAKAGKAAAKAHAKAHAKKAAAKPVTFVLKGTYQGGDTVAVTGGNAFAKRAGLIGQTVSFSFATAKVSVADVDTDGAATLSDVQVGDKVVVQVKAPRSTTAADVLTARKLVDQTQPATDAS